MHNPGHNPYYTTESPYDFNVTGQSRYLGGIHNYWKPLKGFFSDKKWSDWEDIGQYTPETYGYQGMNPIISNALSDTFLFDPGDDVSSEIQKMIELDLYNPERYSLDVDDYGVYNYGEKDYDVEQQFQDLAYTGGEGIEGYLPFTDVFDPASIARTLSIMLNIEPGSEDMIRASAVEALTPEMLEQAEVAYYEPYEFSKRDELVTDLGTNIGKVSTGGFAGSGGRRAGLSGAEREYDSNYAEILATIDKLQAKSTEDVLDTIYGWQELT